MPGLDLVLVLRYRKAVTYGFHVLLGALEEHETATRYEVRFGDTPESTARHIADSLDEDVKVLVLWSFYSPDAAALAEELSGIRAVVDGPGVVHVAGGVHATAEPVQTLDAGWDVAAIGEGETTLLALVDAVGQPAGITGLAYRDAAGAIVRTGRPHRRLLDDFRGFSLRWDRFNALEITRGCIFLARNTLNYYLSCRALDHGLAGPSPRREVTTIDRSSSAARQVRRAVRPPLTSFAAAKVTLCQAWRSGAR